MGIRNKRKRRMIRAGVLLTVLALLAGAAFLFQVKKITVYGNDRHSSKEISQGLSNDFLTRNTLYLLWKYKDGEIPDTLPFLDSLHVQMKSPSSIEVQVKEKKLTAYMDKGGYVYFDEDGTVLEISDEVYEKIPLITGVPVGEVTLYQKLPTESSAQLRTILSLTDLLAYYELNASEVRFGDNMEITVFIDGVEVQLGQDEYLEEKIANLNKIMPKLEGQYGALHLESFTGRNEPVSFTPTQGPEIEDVSEGPGGSDDADAAGGEADGGDAETDAPGEDGGDGADAGGTDGAQGADPADTADGAGTDDPGADAQGADGASEEDGQEDTGTVYPMVYDSSGTLVYNVHVENGVVVDANGNPVAGVIVNENGNVQDAYMNQFDPQTGELIQ